jgi:hypothetical protein
MKASLANNNLVMKPFDEHSNETKDGNFRLKNIRGNA